MAAPSQGHQGDPYAPDPGEYQIPYSWVAEPEEVPVFPPDTAGDDILSDDTASGFPSASGPGGRRPRRRGRAAVFSVLAVAVLVGAGATAAQLDMLPTDLFTTSGEPTEDTTYYPDDTDEPTAEPTDDTTGETTDEPGDTTGPADEWTDDQTAEVTTEPADEESGPPVSWNDLAVGDCADEAGGGGALLVDCDSAHEYEVLSTFFLATALPAYPGDAAAEEYVGQQCSARFDLFQEEYRGTEDLDWTYSNVSEASAEAGSPTHCYLVDSAGGFLYGSAIDETYGSLG